jgi:threonine dehydratase
MYLLGQIVAKGLATMGRMMKIFILLKDKPGALKEVVDELASLSANIVEVVHDRLSSSVRAGTTGVTLSLETEDQKHTDEIIQHLKEKNIEFKILA